MTKPPKAANYTIEKVLQLCFDNDMEFSKDAKLKSGHNVYLKSDCVIHLNVKGNISLQGKIDNKALEVFKSKTEWVAPKQEKREIDKDYKMPFGKYVGIALKEIPGQYLGWIYKNLKLKTGLKEYIKSNVTGL